jgi:crossover junction endodeoxyribonuclease RuvC
MRILGIDPGFAIAGYGVVDFASNKFKAIDYGVIKTESNMPFSKRLQRLYLSVNDIIEIYKPDFVSIEELFFNTNVKTAIAVGHARGAIMLSAENLSVPIYEYTPLQIKQAITGYGRADKAQMQQMVKTLLGLAVIPKPDDAADALAAAICHGHSHKMTEVM